MKRYFRKKISLKYLKNKGLYAISMTRISFIQEENNFNKDLFKKSFVNFETSMPSLTLLMY